MPAGGCRIRRGALVGRRRADLRRPLGRGAARHRLARLEPARQRGNRRGTAHPRDPGFRCGRARRPWCCPSRRRLSARRRAPGSTSAACRTGHRPHRDRHRGHSTGTVRATVAAAAGRRGLLVARNLDAQRPGVLDCLFGVRHSGRLRRRPAFCRESSSSASRCSSPRDSSDNSRRPSSRHSRCTMCRTTSLPPTRSRITRSRSSPSCCSASGRWREAPSPSEISAGPPHDRARR